MFMKPPPTTPVTFTSVPFCSVLINRPNREIAAEMAVAAAPWSDRSWTTVSNRSLGRRIAPSHAPSGVFSIHSLRRSSSSSSLISTYRLMWSHFKPIPASPSHRRSNRHASRSYQLACLSFEGPGHVSPAGRPEAPAPRHDAARRGRSRRCYSIRWWTVGRSRRPASGVIAADRGERPRVGLRAGSEGQRRRPYPARRR